MRLHSGGGEEIVSGQSAPGVGANNNRQGSLSDIAGGVELLNRHFQGKPEIACTVRPDPKKYAVSTDTDTRLRQHHFSVVQNPRAS
jgi:hypothetical protein